MKIIIKEVVTKHDVFNVATDLLRKSKAPSVQVQPSKQEKPTTSTEPAKTEPTSKEPETQQPKLVYKQVINTKKFRQWLAEAENKIADFWNKERQKYIGQSVQQRPPAPPRRQNENLIFEQQQPSSEQWILTNKGQITKKQNLIIITVPYKESFNVNFIVPDPKIETFDSSLSTYFEVILLKKGKPNIMKPAIKLQVKPAIYIDNKQIQRGKLWQIKTNIKESLFTRFKQLANII